MERPSDLEILIVMAKEPRLGLAKTRLAAEIGAQRAREIAEALLLDTLALAGDSGRPVLIAYAPADAEPWFARFAPAAMRWAQPEGDLGERMRHAVGEARRRGASRCVVIGMDSPHMAPSAIGDAFAALEGCDVCIGPALDGGYYLIGMREQEPEIFRHVPWSSPDVLAVTLERCEGAGLSVEQLATEFDVDDVVSLGRLKDVLAERPEAAPRTRLLLD